MTNLANKPRDGGSTSLKREEQLSTNLNSKHGVLQRLRRGRNVRSRFVDSHISKGLAFQIRSLREKEGWSQQYLAEKIGSNQNAVYRAENPNYGKQTLTTLKKIAAAFDVALIVRFVPFSELIDWVSGTPRTVHGLIPSALTVSDFESEERDDPAFKQAEVKEPEPEKVFALTTLQQLGGRVGKNTGDWHVRLQLAEDAIALGEKYPAIKTMKQMASFGASETTPQKTWTLRELARFAPGPTMAPTPSTTEIKTETHTALGEKQSDQYRVVDLEPSRRVRRRYPKREEYYGRGTSYPRKRKRAAGSNQW